MDRSAEELTDMVVDIVNGLNISEEKVLVNFVINQKTKKVTMRIDGLLEDANQEKPFYKLDMCGLSFREACLRYPEQAIGALKKHRDRQKSTDKPEV